MVDHIVTRDSFQALVDRDDQVAIHAVGRALVVLLNRQTEAEAKTNTTRNLNGMGFTPADARTGCISAKYYIKYGKLEDWQLKKWTKKEKSGYSRIVKYWSQVDEVARKKADLFEGQ